MRRLHRHRRRQSRARLRAALVCRKGKKITTIEGLGTPDKPHAIQAAFVAEQAAQCGYCTTGIVMTAAALFARKPDPTLEEAKGALAGNLCRCGNHQRVLNAMMRVAGRANG